MITDANGSVIERARARVIPTFGGFLAKVARVDATPRAFCSLRTRGRFAVQGERERERVGVDDISLALMLQTK